MRQFSIIPDKDYSPVDQYVDYLKYEVYSNPKMMSLSESFNDPLFLNQLAVIQSGEINKAIKTNGKMFCEGMRCTNDNIRKASSLLSKRIEMVSSHIVSSLDNGFTSLNMSLCGIGDGIAKTNSELQSLHGTVSKGIGAICNNQRETNKQLGNIANNQRVTNMQLGNISNSLYALKRLFGTHFAVLETQLTTTNELLNDILKEVRIPESQRERRYHIEQGTKYLSMGIKEYLSMEIKEHDLLYCEDAIDEFEKALNIERKDYYSRYYLGFMYLRFPELIDLDRAKTALELFVHYARPEYETARGSSLLERIDEAYMMLAEIQYLKGNCADAIQCLAKCSNMYAEKVSFTKAKYLSATRDESKMLEASEILKNLLDENPYLSLQILEDADLINNPTILRMLAVANDSAIVKANSMLSEFLGKFKMHPALKHVVEQASELVAKKTYLDAVEAIRILETIHYTYAFSVSPTKKVFFSPGNLVYDGSYRFVANQYDCGGYFGWGTGNDPTKFVEDNSKYPFFHDWGANSGLIASLGAGWRTLSKEEWEYLIDSTNAIRAGKCGHATVNGVVGLVLLPDGWVTPDGCGFTPGRGCGWTTNSYTIEQWTKMETRGAVFLPAAGLRDGQEVYCVGYGGDYWSSTPNGANYACNLDFGSGDVDANYSCRRYSGQSVRLVR